MDAENNKEVIDTSKRPKWVWAITIWYAFSFLSVIYSFYAINIGQIPLNEVQKEYFANVGVIDMVITFISSLLAITAAITLFMLKKITIKLWVAVFSFAIFAHLYSILTSNYLEVLDEAGVFGIIFGTTIIVLIYFYAKRLNARGYLS